LRAYNVDEIHGLCVSATQLVTAMGGENKINLARENSAKQKFFLLENRKKS